MEQAIVELNVGGRKLVAVTTKINVIKVKEQFDTWSRLATPAKWKRATKSMSLNPSIQ
ncbi:MAG: hypothetical protein NT096_00335 [Proteobacteria bacterium]|nr:hypothetical protein [Pseudomonadota bacterium]